MEPSTPSTFTHFSPRLLLLTKCKIRGDAIFRRLWKPPLFHFLSPKAQGLLQPRGCGGHTGNRGEPHGFIVGVGIREPFPRWICVRGKRWEQDPMACPVGGEKLAQFMR